MSSTHTKRRRARALEALAARGLIVDSDPQNIISVRSKDSPHAPAAEVLLAADAPLEGKAFEQLANFAAVAHPHGGCVCQAAATPDFHPGAEVPVGAVIATEGLVIPQALGTDINCGMRLHVVDLPLSRFEAHKERFVSLLRGDLLLGTRNLPLSAAAMRALFRHGLYSWLEALTADAARPSGLGGQLARVDLEQLVAEQPRVFDGGGMDGDPRWAPEALVGGASGSNEGAKELRDGSLATIGGGNHFVELQRVEELVHRREAYRLGLRQGQLAFMIHSGSRAVGLHIGKRWIRRAREAWPSGLAHPDAGLYPLMGASAEAFLEAMATAANYAYVNRLLLAELVRQRLREVYGAELEAPLVIDVPHNIVLLENGRLVHRKGATPAHEGQPLLIPGSMGHPSYVACGRGNPRFISSASHGAGRAVTRFAMGRRGSEQSDEALGLQGVSCITLRPERRREEAPAAYKAIGPVLKAQVDAGLVSTVARLHPLLTFKG